MPKDFTTHPYHNSVSKTTIDLIFSLFGLVLFFPFFLLFCFTLNLGLVFFKQKRVGYHGKIFEMIKFRTMYPGAETQQKRYKHLNEADGPVFKIFNDPRYTKVGKILARTGFDELPQLINVLKGEMSLVGPRPLPVYEARKLNKYQKVRELVKPGITSSWVVKGSHKLTFNQWMKLDKEYVENGSFFKDLEILLLTIFMVLKLTFKNLLPKK